MRITVRRRGGFAGLDEELLAVDTATPGRDPGRQLEEAVRSAGFFALPERLDAAEVGADTFDYAVAVQDGDRRHTVSFRSGGDLSDDRSPAPEQLRLVLDAADRVR